MQWPLASSDFLALMATHNLHLLREHAAPKGVLKREMITLRFDDGGTVAIRSGMFQSERLELPGEILNDFLAHSFVRADGATDEGHHVFRLTDDGARAGTEAAASRDVPNVV